MASYSIVGLVVGLVGACWFGWHVLRPLPTHAYWPGWWYRNGDLSTVRLRTFAVGGVVGAVGFIGVASYPAVAGVAVGLGMLLLGSLVQVLAVLSSPTRDTPAGSGATSPRVAAATAAQPRFTWYVAALIPAYVIVIGAVNWEIGQLFPAYASAPAGGYAQTKAIVEATYPSDHDQVKYVYAVGGRTFEAVSFAEGPEGHASQLIVGQAITIWYEVADPALSCSCMDPHELQRTNNDATPVALVLSLLITAGFGLMGARLVLGSWQSVSALVRMITSSRGARLARRNHRGGSKWVEPRP
jgi:hypothetical protein